MLSYEKQIIPLSYVTRQGMLAGKYITKGDLTDAKHLYFQSSWRSAVPLQVPKSTLFACND